MKKRSFALALACALSLSLLTSCGGGETTTNPETSNPPSQSETQNPETETQTPEIEQPEAAPEQSEETTEELEQEIVVDLKLSHSDVTLKAEGNQFTLSGNLEGEKLYYGSENESIATVDENGVVTAVALGVTNIVVETEDGRTAECIVRCTWEEKTEEPEQSEIPEQEAPAQTSVDLKAFVGSLVEKHGENFAANADVVEFGMLNDFYPGLSDIATKQTVVYQPMMGAVVCEIALVEVENAADVDAVKAIFQNRINMQVDGGAWYPESIEGWQNNSRIVSNGNCVMMIAWQFCDDAVASFNALF